MDVLKHSASTLIIVSCIGICHLYLKTFTVIELFWRWGKSIRESHSTLNPSFLIRSWLGSDRDISRTLGLLILHQCSVHYIVCYFFMCSKKRQGGSATKFKKYYAIVPSITFLFLRTHFLAFQPFIFRVPFPPNIEKLKNSDSNTHTYSLVLIVVTT